MMQGPWMTWAAALTLAAATSCVVPWISDMSTSCETSSNAPGELEVRIAATSRSLPALPVTKRILFMLGKVGGRGA